MKYKLSDGVSMRCIQIFQEALIFGIDGADLFRQVRLVVDPNDQETLMLDLDYEKQVIEHHNKALADAELLSVNLPNQQTKLIIE
jgi:hypothetical protein